MVVETRSASKAAPTRARRDMMAGADGGNGWAAANGGGGGAFADGDSDADAAARAAAKGDVWHKGVAISMWQNSGDEHSNWTAFIRSKLPFKWLPFGFKRFSGRWHVNERSPDTWNR